MSAGIPRPACDGPYTVGRFSKPTHAPSGGKPPKSTPFRVYFLNSIFLASLSWLLRKLAQAKRGFLERTSKGLGPDLADCGYFCIKRSFTKSLEGPGPRFGQFWLFLYKAALYKEPRRARAQIWPNLTISVLSGPLESASKGPGPDLAKFCGAGGNLHRA